MIIRTAFLRAFRTIIRTAFYIGFRNDYQDGFLYRLPKHIPRKTRSRLALFLRNHTKIHLKLLRNGIFVHLNHYFTVSAVNASTCFIKKFPS